MNQNIVNVKETLKNHFDEWKQNTSTVPPTPPSTECLCTHLVTLWFDRWYEQLREESKLDDYSENIFLGFLWQNYRFAQKKNKKNKALNTKCKNYFLLLLCICVVLQAFLLTLLFGCYLSGTAVFSAKNLSLDDILKIEFLLFALMLCVLFAFSKYMDIKKYQETWTRHQYTLYQYHQLMLLYMQGMNSKGEVISNPVQLRQQFKASAIEIMDENQKRFTHNMEDKETNLMEGITNFFSNS